MSTSTCNNYPKRFSMAANTYDSHALVQGNAVYDLINMIPADSRFGDVLDIGCGTGLLTASFAQHFPCTHLVALDESKAMLDAAARKFALKTSYPVTWKHSSFSNFEATKPFDCIISSSSLQWMGSPATIGTKLSGFCRKGSTLFLAIMTRGTLAELHEVRSELHSDYHPAQSLPCHKEYIDVFRQPPFNLLESKMAHYKTHHRDVRALLQSLHEQGVTGGKFARGNKPLPRGILNHLIRSYEDRYSNADGSIPATYEVSFYCVERTV